MKQKIALALCVFSYGAIADDNHEKKTECLVLEPNQSYHLSYLDQGCIVTANPYANIRFHYMNQNTYSVLYDGVFVDAYPGDIMREKGGLIMSSMHPFTIRFDGNEIVIQELYLGKKKRSRRSIITVSKKTADSIKTAIGSSVGDTLTSDRDLETSIVSIAGGAIIGAAAGVFGGPAAAGLAGTGATNYIGENYDKIKTSFDKLNTSSLTPKPNRNRSIAGSGFRIDNSFHGYGGSISSAGCGAACH